MKRCTWQPAAPAASADASADARVAPGLERVAALDDALAVATAQADATVRDACPQRWAARERRRASAQQATLQRAIVRRAHMLLWSTLCDTMCAGSAGGRLTDPPAVRSRAGHPHAALYEALLCIPEHKINFQSLLHPHAKSLFHSHIQTRQLLMGQ